MENGNTNHPPIQSGGGYSTGAISSFLTTFFTFPIHKTIFRQQLHTVTIRVAANQLRTEGFRHLYRGLAPPLLVRTVQGTLLFGTQGTFQHLLCNGEDPKAKHRCLSGVLSGTLEAILFVPLERVQNILQDGRNNRFPSISSILQEFRCYGPRKQLMFGLYRGFTPVLSRNALGGALYFSFSGPLTNMLSISGVPAWVPSLVSGALIGALTSLSIFPLTVLVPHMQAQVGKELPPATKVLGLIWQQCGGKISHLYRGASLIVIRSCINWGLTNTIRDAFSR
ncbi:solute carrier family 25 member 53 [Discoglossus pictus]